MESHAYAFIHTEDIKARISELFGGEMQFDVIIGNPPYQLGSDGETRDVPIYQHFVDQAKNLNPRFLSMVIPARWMASGLGLSEFRKTMLGDPRIRELVDYPAASEVFPGVEIKAGGCFFLWDAEHKGLCNVTTVRGGGGRFSAHLSAILASMTYLLEMRVRFRLYIKCWAVTNHPSIPYWPGIKSSDGPQISTDSVRAVAPTMCQSTIFAR